MTQQYKGLILRDLCTRLPYGVKAKVNVNKELARLMKPIFIGEDGEYSYMCPSIIFINEDNIKYVFSGLFECKPLLFPLSNMTEEQKEELKELCNMYDPYHDYDSYENWGIEVFNKHIHSDNYKFTFTADVIDWFCRHHFDYLGLIEKGLAIDATNMGVY